MRKKSIWSLIVTVVLAAAVLGCGSEVPAENNVTEFKETVESTTAIKESEAAVNTETPAAEKAENTIPEGFVVPASQYDGLKSGYATVEYEGLVFDVPSNFAESASTAGMWESGFGANVNVQLIPDGAAMIPDVTVDMYLNPVQDALREALSQNDLEVKNTHNAHFKVYDAEAFAYDMAYSVNVEGITIKIEQTQVMLAYGDDARILTFSFSSLDPDNSKSLLHTIETIRFSENE